MAVWIRIRSLLPLPLSLSLLHRSEMAFALKTTGSKAIRAQTARKSTVVVKAALGPTTKVRCSARHAAADPHYTAVLLLTPPTPLAHARAV